MNIPNSKLTNMLLNVKHLLNLSLSGLYFDTLVMAFFTSEFECKLDAKGRLVLPSKLKSILPEASIRHLVIRKGFEPNLIIYPLNEYKKIHTNRELRF